MSFYHTFGDLPKYYKALIHIIYVYRTSVVTTSTLSVKTTSKIFKGGSENHSFFLSLSI